MPYLVMLASEKEQGQIIEAGYESVDAREIDETLADPMGFVIWLPGDPMDWLEFGEREVEGD